MYYSHFKERNEAYAFGKYIPWKKNQTLDSQEMP